MTLILENMEVGSSELGVGSSQMGDGRWEMGARGWEMGDGRWGRGREKGDVPRSRLLGMRAFTVIELMVAISVMTLIVLVLYGVFDQTQRAMRGNVSQTDVLEGGRATMDMIGTDFGQMRASEVWLATNLFLQLILPQTVQALPGQEETRFSELQECFFLTKPGAYWEQYGYVVLPYRDLNVRQPLGTLYRIVLSNHVSHFTADSLSRLYFTNRSELFRDGTHALFQKVTDGVVHFRVRVLDSRGIPYSLTNGVSTNLFMSRDPLATVEEELRYAFLEDALPAAIEVELGLLDSQVVGRLRSMPNPTLAAEFLSKQSGRLHIFEQRIPIRTAR